MLKALYRAATFFGQYALLAVVLLPLRALASPSFLVDADWLAEHIEDPGLIVLEVCYHPDRYFTVGHIPGAVQVQRFKDLGDNQTSPVMRFPSRESFQETLRGWGVNDDSTLVLYDDSSTALAARLYYLLDARPHGMYTGEVIRHSVMGGHIPGAINIVSLDGTDGQSGKWREDATLAALYAELPKDKRIYVYCHDGFRMGLAYLQLKHLGYRDVRLYNGGWSHCGNELTLPVVEGPDPYDEAFGL